MTRCAVEQLRQYSAITEALNAFAAAKISMPPAIKPPNSGDQRVSIVSAVSEPRHPGQITHPVTSGNGVSPLERTPSSIV